LNDVVTVNIVDMYIKRLLCYFSIKVQYARRLMGDAVETRKKLLAIAIQLFATKGFKGTTTRDIARSSGMTISNIYYYFGSKHGLLLAVLESISKRLEAELIRVSEMAIDPVELISLLVSTHLDQIASNSVATRLLFADQQELTAEAKQVNKQFQTNIFNIYRKALQNCQKVGHMKARNVSVVAFHILGLVEWHLLWYKPQGGLSLDQIKQEALHSILFGLLGDAGLDTLPAKETE
jgi:AcrR family transcriptional regulator